MVTRGRAALGAPFRYLWAATAAASVGDGIRLAALPLLAASLTADPLLVSDLTVALDDMADALASFW